MPRRESLRDALARIPDLKRDEEAAAVVAGDPRAPSSVPRPPGQGRPAQGGAVARTPSFGDSSEKADSTVPATPTEQGGAARRDLVEDGSGSMLTESGLRAMASRLLNGQIPADAEIAPLDAPAAPDRSTTDDLSGDDLSGDDVFVPRAGPEVPDPAPGAEDRPPMAVARALPPDAPEWLVAAAEVEQRSAAARVAARRPPTPTWRRVGFGALVVLLIAAIPVLGRIGYGLVTESTDGEFSSSMKSPTDPGYETEVVSTPTQIVLHNDADGRPVAATVMSLSGVDGGGAVIFVPLAAEVRGEPAFGVDRLSRAYDVLSVRPPDGRKQVAVQVGSLLNVGIDGVVEVDDRGWAQLIDPVAPLAINNPDPVEIDGRRFESGPIELGADDVGPYLAATRDGESAFNALVRHELVWTAWLDAVAESDRDDVVPGESSTGIGLFARSLAAGPVTYSIVPTTPDRDDPTLLRVDFNTLDAMVLAAVPSPDPALPGSRATVRLLNGVSADAIPEGIIQTVVQIGGSISVIGNGPSFDRDETTIVYALPDSRGYAELLQAALGGGTVRHDREAPDSVTLTVILGRDVIDQASATTTTADLDTDSDLGAGFSTDDSTGGSSTDDEEPGLDPEDSDSNSDLDPEVPE